MSDDQLNLATLIVELMKEGRREETKPLYKQLMDGMEEKTSVIQETSNYLEQLKDRIAGKIKASIIPTGFRDIDDRIFGAVKGNIMTICARTGGGKTTLGINIALNMLKEHKVGFISLEMTEEEICDKIVSRIARVRHSSLTINRFQDREIEGMTRKENEIKYAIENLVRAYDCYNIDSLSQAIEEMVEKGCEVIFVDWIGMIEAPGNSQPERVRNVMGKLKQLAITKNIAIIAMQQLNRQMDGEGRMPRMYDIADGSAIEKISSPVLIMWREDDTYSNITIYKARRLNADKFMDRDGRIDRFNAVNLRIKDDLGYSGFQDYPNANDIVKDTKPF